MPAPGPAWQPTRERAGPAAQSSVKCGERNSVSKQILHDLLHDHGEDMKFQGGARPKLMPQKGKMKTFGFDKGMSRTSQSQRHLSTVLFNRYGKGEEVQSSFSNDHDSVFLSTNLNGVNQQVQDDLQDRGDLKMLTGEVALSHGLESMTREEAMKDRTVRHALKMYQRISEHLSKTSCILVPAKLDSFDGRHAEIRIEQDPRWSSDSYNLPSGTKYPCLGCRLYFDEQGHFLGVQAGPMWLTAPSISTQIESIVPKGARLDELDETQIEAISKLIAKQYSDMLDKHAVEMGQGRRRDGKGTILHDADSDSDLDEDTFEDTRNRMLDRVRPNLVDGTKVKRSRPLKRKRSSLGNDVPPTVDPDESSTKKRRIED